MKRSIILVILLVSFTYSALSQSSVKFTNPLYRYYSRPGFVNITEINGGTGLGDTDFKNSEYYFGVTNVFGYQIDRNFFGGVGVGYYLNESVQHIPLYLDIRYNVFLKRVTPFIFADSGLLLDPDNFNHGTKIFINPGVGINKSIYSKLCLSLSAGVMVQMGDNVPRTSFVNFKLGLIFKKNAMKLYKPRRDLIDYCIY